MKNFRIVELYISVYDGDDVIEYKKINYWINVNVIFYC